MNELDRYDTLLLAELQRDARQTVQQLAAAVGLSSRPAICSSVAALHSVSAVVMMTSR